MSVGKSMSMMNKKLGQLRNLAFQTVKVDPWVPITLGDGVERKLEFSFGAVVEIFQNTGFNINNGEVSASDLMDKKLAATLLKAGVSTHHPEVQKMDDPAFYHLLQMRHFEYYRACLMEALNAAQPDPEEVEKIFAVDESEEKKEPVELPLPVTPISSTSGEPATDS